MAEDREGIAFIAEFFRHGPNGYLVDIGALDAETGSMSRILIEAGWGGLLVEPLPESFTKLQAAYRDRPGVYLAQVACSDEEGEAELYPCKGISTLSPEWRDACAATWKHAQYGPPVRVQKRRLADLLRECGAPTKIDLLLVDTEGHDLQVLKGMDWGRKPSLVCVETLDMVHPDRRGARGEWLPSPELDSFLRAQGYGSPVFTSGNGIYARERPDD